ncbi:uncharacterized protein G2W53_039567 [Senna tora]|uniref:Uncharacterized protein n=1 Tax=Senna tora TaxID=362788 RepID=A0A834SPQ4_9FABA|nr:uncharacterized protein G2W53_039567 [Senna tora]
MWCVTNAISTTTVTIHPLFHEIICTTARVAVILNNLTKAEQVKSSGNSKHVEYCKDTICHIGQKKLEEHSAKIQKLEAMKWIGEEQETTKERNSAIMTNKMCNENNA